MPESGYGPTGTSENSKTKTKVDVTAFLKGIIIPCGDRLRCRTGGKHLQQLKRGFEILNFWQQSPSHSSPSQQNSTLSSSELYMLQGIQLVTLHL